MSLWEWIGVGQEAVEIIRKKPEIEEKYAAAIHESIERKNAWVDHIKAWRDIGQEFEYLGRKMVLTSIYRERAHTYGTCINIIKDPHIEARYADNFGVIQTLALTLAEVQALAAASTEKAASQS